MNKRTLSVITVTSLAWCSYGHAELLGCLIEPDRVADVGSQSTGVLETLHVERGDVVAAGQIVARLSAQVEKASVSVAEVKAKAEAEALQAQAAFELAQRKLERTRDLVKRDFVSDQALDQAEAETRVAQQRVEQAREAQRVAHREHLLSNAQLSQREVRSPFAGLVVERYRTEGERIEREPVIRVARIDPLRIEAIVPAVQFGQIKSGQQATVKTDLPDFPMLTAQVTLVDRVIDPASNSFRVRLTVPNPGNRIPSGLRCRIAFGANNDVPTGAAPSAAINTSPSAAAVPLNKQPVTARQIAPARWQQEAPDMQPRVIPVALSMHVNKPELTRLADLPARFVSSTLKFAMAELGRTTPGARLLDAVTQPAVTRARQTLNQKPAMLAMTVRLPIQGKEAPVIAAPVVAEVRQPMVLLDSRLSAASALRVASAR